VVGRLFPGTFAQLAAAGRVEKFWIEDAVGLAVVAEELGFGSLWLGGLSADLKVAESALAATKDLTVATGVINIWQCPVVLLADVRSVGVQGDGRSYGYPVVLRPVTSEDAMTADWARLPGDLLARISTRITNEVPEVNRVVLDITSKPPGTIEWE